MTTNAIGIVIDWLAAIDVSAMTWIITLSTALIGVVVTSYYMLAMTENIGPLGPAALQSTIVLGPYIVLGLLAWFMRWHHRLALASLVGALVVTCIGAFGYADLYGQFIKRDPTVPWGSNWLPFLIAMVQWVITLCLAVVALVLLVYQKKDKKPQAGG